jgi:PadR family transcriptional regulator PadR
MINFKSRPVAARAAPVAATKQGHKVHDPIPKLTPREQLILFSVANREMYGLAIQQAVADASHGREQLTLGTIYPVLKTLEDKGLVVGRWEENSVDNRAGARRRYYRLTEQGFAAVEYVLEFQQRLLDWEGET